MSSLAPARSPAAGRLPRTLLAPVLASALLCAVALLIDARPGDLAAHVYRSDLFRREGFTIWDGNWYGGHDSLSYSVIFPPLGGLLGPLAVGAIEAAITAACFAALAARQWGESAARLGALWLGAGTATLLFSGRIPFGLGVMFGTAAVLAAQRRRHVASAVLAACCGLASPLAGVFLGLVAAALLLGGARRAGLVLGVACAAPLLAIAVAFPEKAREPFDFSTFWPLALALAASVVLIPGEERTLRIGAVLYALATVAFLLLDTPMGGNAVRLAALFGGPLLACAIAGRPAGGRNRRLALGLLLAGFAFLQWSPAVRDAWKGLGDPASQASFYRPLLAELDRLAAAGETIDRIEVPFTQAHWDAAEVGRRYPMARGWERQLDVPRNPIFYGGPLDATTYEAWLAEHAVGYVALPASTPDYSSRRERALIERGLPYLREVWRSRDWRLYAFTRPHAVVVPRGGAAMKLAALGNDELTIDVARPGTATVRVHWSPYWKAGGACVERDGDWTRLIARRPGRIRMAIDFAPWRIVSHGRRCA